MALRPLWPGLLAVLLVALLAVVRLPLVTPGLDRVGYLVFDAFQRTQPRAYEDAAVRVVDIDEETIRRLGQWPWPRSEVARLNDALVSAGASAIAYDIVFSEPDRTSPPRLARRADLPPGVRAALATLPDSDAGLARSFAGGPVVDGFFLTQDPARQQAQAKAGFAVAGEGVGGAVRRYSDAVLPLPELADAASGLGFVSITGDSDSIVRRAPLVARQGDTLLPSLALEALRVAQGAGSITIRTDEASGELGGGAGDIVALKVGAFEVPVTDAGELWMHYSEPAPQRVVPAWKLMTGALSQAEREALFGGHIVFVGAGAIGLRDLVSTPTEDRELGVMVHAQATEQMILGRFLVRPDWAPGLELLLLLVGGIALVVALPRLGAVRGAAIGAVAVALAVGGSYYAFAARHFLLNPTWPVLALTFGYFTATTSTFYREERQRAFIHRAFDRYLSPELVRRIAADPAKLELGGEEREMSVLFADIRGFSRISEGLGPRDLIDFLVAFLTPMTDLLLKRKATIDKYIGDAILAFWNAPLDDPDHAANAARGALDMQRRLAEMNREARRKGDGRWPGEVRIGIGLNAGPCCVGNIGSAQRLSYSLIGDTVNLASRLEGLSKYYGVPILVGGAFAAMIPGFALLPVDRVRVVGRDHPEEVFALLGDEAMAADPAFAALAKAHGHMVDAYRSRQFDAAATLNDRHEAAMSEAGLTRLVMLYRDRLAALLVAPPGEGWDGVFEATSK